MIVIKGRVVSGKGVGSRYVGLSVYNNLFTALLGDEPFKGTLNIVLDDLDVTHLINLCLPRVVNDIVHNGVIYGGLYYWYCSISKAVEGPTHEELAIALRPFKSRHPSNVIEIVSTKHLRSTLSLVDGDMIIIRIYCK